MPHPDDIADGPEAGAPELSVVVPARNEARRLPATVGRLDAFVSAHGDVEVVVVADEGSADTTVALAHELAEAREWMRVVRVQPVGKGFAVARGVRAARGHVVLLADTDLSVDPDEFHALSKAADDALAIASRSVPGARRVGEPWSRYVLGRVFNLAVRLLVLPGIRDSQCGFKAFPRAYASDLLDDQAATGWVFDVELLARARVAGMRVVEVPVTWTYGHESTLRPMRDARSVVRELLTVARAYGRVGGSRRPGPRPPG